jgi:UDP-glucose 4-epimerase
MNMQNVLLTGATGFIGRHLFTTLVRNGFVCRTLVRDVNAARSIGIPEGSILEAQIEAINGNVLPFKGIDTIIHSAALVHQMKNTDSPLLETYRRINRDGTLRLAKTGLDAGIQKFIFLSTVKVMGDFEGTSKILNEKDVPAPSDPYSISKFEAEEGLRRLFDKYKGARCIILRLPMVYGPGNKGNMLTLLKAARRKIPLPLKGATGKRSMIYVGNICDAILTTMNESRKPSDLVELYFLTDTIDHTSNDLYSSIYRAINGKTGTFYLPPCLLRILFGISKKSRAVVSRLFDDYRFSCERFQSEYKWKPAFGLTEGIAETIQWYKTDSTPY